MPLSEKQWQILAFPYTKYDALICDGAIRSGKTVWMTYAFIEDAMRRFNGQRFGICGKTVDSAKKNIVMPYLNITEARQKYSIVWRNTEKLLIVTCGEIVNIFEIFGGKDEGSAALIQGRTLAGVLFDEVALMPRSFVEQACARCSVDGSRMWFNCNPEGQLHWFNQEWIKKAKERNALHLHFTMQDNPSLSDKVRERYEKLYSGVFYDRFIRGLWVSAEGVIYDCFTKEHVVSTPPQTEGEYYVSSDFGIQNATTFLLWRKEKDTSRWVCLDEYYYSGRDNHRQKTVGELAADLKEMLGDIKPHQIIVDPSAAALIAQLRKAGYRVLSAENDVLDGISDVATMLKGGRLLFCSKCTHTITEFGEYVWDAKKAAHGEDVPIKENDHCMDAVRYFVRTKHLVKKLGESKYQPIFM